MLISDIRQRALAALIPPPPLGLSDWIAYLSSRETCATSKPLLVSFVIDVDRAGGFQHGPVLAERKPLHHYGRGSSRLKTASTRDPTMPRFYFHLTDGNQVLNNHKGIDLSGNVAARADAVALARDLKHGAVMPGWNWTGWFVAIVDQHGHTVDKVPIADV